MRIAVRLRMFGALLMLPLAHASGQRVLVLPFADLRTSPGREFGEALLRELTAQGKRTGIDLVSEEGVTMTLRASGFPDSTPLAQHDQRAVAILLRANEYLSGSISRAPAGYRVVGALHMPSERERQPLIDSVFHTPSAGATRLAREYVAARAQLGGWRECIGAARRNDLQTARAAAERAIAAYPGATIARSCLASILEETKAPPPEVLKFARVFHALDTTNIRALQLLADAFAQAAQFDSAAFAVARINKLRPSYPSDTCDLDCGRSPQSGRELVARIDSAIALNRGDPELLRLRWMMLLSFEDYANLVLEGNRLAQLDSTFADSTYYIRMATAYERLGQRAKAVETVERGLAKYPAQPTLLDQRLRLRRRVGR